MEEHQSLSHTVWDCKYHVVFIPKCRRKTLYLELRKHLGEVFHKLAAQKEAKIVEGHLITKEIPRLCRGGSRSLTVPAVAPQSPSMTLRRQATKHIDVPP